MSEEELFTRLAKLMLDSQPSYASTKKEVADGNLDEDAALTLIANELEEAFTWPTQEETDVIDYSQEEEEEDPIRHIVQEWDDENGWVLGEAVPVFSNHEDAEHHAKAIYDATGRATRAVTLSNIVTFGID